MYNSISFPFPPMVGGSLAGHLLVDGDTFKVAASAWWH